MDWFLIVVVAVVALMMLVANIYLIILYQVRQQRTTDTVKRETSKGTRTVSSRSCVSWRSFDPKAHCGQN